MAVDMFFHILKINTIFQLELTVFSFSVVRETTWSVRDDGASGAEEKLDL